MIGGVSDAHVSLLLNEGYLTRHTGPLGADGYLFSMPNAGAAVRSVAGALSGRRRAGPHSRPRLSSSARPTCASLTRRPSSLHCPSTPPAHSAAGRAEILSLLRRRRHPELLESELSKRKLQRSVLGVRWHVTDMLGAGLLLRIDTAVGPLLRVAARGG